MSLFITNAPPCSLHVFVEEAPVEVISNRVVDESLLYFWFGLGLIPENHVIVPSAFDLRRACRSTGVQIH